MPIHRELATKMNVVSTISVHTTCITCQHIETHIARRSRDGPVKLNDNSYETAGTRLCLFAVGKVAGDPIVVWHGRFVGRRSVAAVSR